MRISFTPGECRRGLSSDRACCLGPKSLLVAEDCPGEPGCRGLAVAQEQLEGHMLGGQMERVMEMI